MKLIYQKLIALFMLPALVLFSCSDNKNKSQENQKEEKDDTESVEKIIPMEEIFQKLDKAEFSQNWDYDYLESEMPYEVISVSADNFAKFNLLDDDFVNIDRIFIWKYETSEWNMICVGAFYRETHLYYLITLGKDFQKIDELQFAGTWVIRVENPNGGTSAGEEYQTAVINNAQGPIVTFREGVKETYIIDSEGYFVKDVGSNTPVPLKEFSDLFDENKNMPFEVDSVLESGIYKKSYEELNAGQVKTLFINGEDIANLYGQAHVNAFIEIDSIKQAGTYDNFLQSEENYGEIITSQAYAMCKLILDNNIIAYIWGIYDATSEMGPHSSGSLIFISFVDDEKVLSSYPVSKFSFGGDSPAWDEHKITANIYKSGDIEITYLYVYGDYDSGEEERMTDNFSFKFQDGKLTELNENE